MSWDPELVLSDGEVAAYAKAALDVYERSSEDVVASFNALSGSNPWHDVIFAVIRIQLEESEADPELQGVNPMAALALIFRGGVADPVAHFRACEEILKDIMFGNDDVDAEMDSAGVPSDGVPISSAGNGMGSEADPAGIPSDGVKVDPAG